MTLAEFIIRQLPSLAYSLAMTAAVTIISWRLNELNIEGTI